MLSTSKTVFRVIEFAKANASSLELPSHFIEILLLIEDQRFPSHFGIDPIAIMRATRCNLLSIGKRQGASTITQQLHNVRVMARRKPYHRGFRRKCSQILFALTEGNRIPRNAVIKEYLDGVYWGRNIWGVDAASAWYFEKGRQHLSPAESFFLVERLASPNRRSIQRVKVILERDAIKNYLQRNDCCAESILSFYCVDEAQS